MTDEAIEKRLLDEGQKAAPVTISFRPSSLYAELKAYGESLPVKLNPSILACRYIKDGLIRDGWLKADGAPALSESERDAVINARAAGVDPVAALLAATETALATQ